MAALIKDPDSVLDFGADWTAALAAESDTIVSSTWFIADPPQSEPPDPDYLSIGADSHTTTTTTVWLSKGALGVTYTVTNRTTTAGGRTDDVSLSIKIKEK